MSLTIKKFEGLSLGPGLSMAAKSDLVAEAGCVTVIKGDSGSGKSCILELLKGHRRAVDAKNKKLLISVKVKAVQVDDEGGESLPQDHDLRREDIAYLPQEDILRPFLTPHIALEDWCNAVTFYYSIKFREQVQDIQKRMKKALFKDEESKDVFENGTQRYCQKIQQGHSDGEPQLRQR